MNKKKIIVIILIVVILFGIVGLYQTFATSSSIANNINSYDVTLSNNSAITVPARGAKTIIYKVHNSNNGIVKYGVGYTSNGSVGVRYYTNTIDPVTGTIGANENKFIKLYITNDNSSAVTVTLSTVLGYENGGDLIVPNGVTLVSDYYAPTLAQNIIHTYRTAGKDTVTNNGIEYQVAKFPDINNPTWGLINDKLGGTTTDENLGNIRYYGANPDNYVYFNCDNYLSSSNCEIWRIIGVFNGKVKIMRGSPIGIYSWDNKDTTTGAETAYGKNDWTDARLMKLLNPSNYYTVDPNDNGYGASLYYNRGSGTCYSGQNNATISCNFTNTGIKENTRDLISEVTWNLGGNTSTAIYSNQFYVDELGTEVYSGNPTIWTGKIALAYPSDYGYAAELGLNKCNANLVGYSDSNCTGSNWMYPLMINNSTNGGWLLTPRSSNASNGRRVLSSGNVSNYNAYNVAAVVPVLYLNANQKIQGGDGSSTTPYRLR